MKKLHLANGTVYLKNFTNIDLPFENHYLAENRPDLVEINTTTKDKYYKEHIVRKDFLNGTYHYKEVVCDQFADIRTLPYEEESIDEILAVQVLEHFTLNEGLEMLKHWVNLLKKGGVLEVDVPDLTGTVEIFNKAGTSTEEISWFLRLMFGSQKNLGNYHKWMYTPDTLRYYFEQLGLKDIEVCNEIKHTYPAFCLRGIK